MPGFVESFGKPVELEKEASPIERFHTLYDERLERMAEGKSIQPEQDLEFIGAIRAVLLEELAELEQARNERQRIAARDLKQLDTLVRTQGNVLDPLLAEDIRFFQTELEQLRDRAATIIANLHLLNSEESRIRNDEHEKRVREAHLATIEKEWESPLDKRTLS